MKKAKTLFPLLITLYLINTSAALADPQWASLTLDNDFFVGNDSGYTNGIFYSWYYVGTGDNELKPNLLTRSLQWLLPESTSIATVNSYTIGQVMITPKNTSIETPTENDLPYSGLLFLNSTYLAIHQTYADKLSTTIGLVGPSSGAKSSQKWMHKLFAADNPKGWDSQLKDEVVFKFTRGRIWRSWISNNEQMDFLLGSEGAVGTIESSISASLMLRYGKDLENSFSTPLLSSSKTSNPAASDGGWYLYTGLTARYIFNQIFTNGNTYRDSPSIDFEQNQIGATAGLAYSWQNTSITLAFNDTNLNEEELAEQLQGLTRYGTLTLAWRY